ncbi:polysaccharide deacetylase family protein [Desulfobotulus sp. H1]|uniref:Polysaccharide deacetylase family protein n=1 Tax=Desulfobotulus pelophilus TaxID=2823377 RepID=A0ABT3NCF8_9BACT|nr:polysaccharide deacetylase family protein [Desulfobotulus pelophilus]MCW7754637.1 polysaccharide deacetylase family protein [Desulfobotulus pelophilus]
MNQKTWLPIILMLFFLNGPAWANSPETVVSERNADPQIRIFMYHHFGMENQYPSTSVSTTQFQEHLAYLKANRYTVITLGEALQRLDAGHNLPQKTACITIDDGYLSVWEHGLPLLEKYGYPATLFIATRYVGGRNYLNWEQIRQLQNKGFEIGNHSHSHDYFLNHPTEKIANAFEADLTQSHEIFKQHLTNIPDLYAYPFGEYTEEMMNILKKHGYRAAAAQRSGVVFAGSNRFALPRFPMNLTYGTITGFTEKIRMNALGVVKASPTTPLITGDNPPVLTLSIQNDRIRTDGLQCFVSGQKNCTIEKENRPDGLTLRVRASDRLNPRRTLYTITAPSKDGSEWFWYTYSWVLPESDSGD